MHSRFDSGGGQHCRVPMRAGSNIGLTSAPLKAHHDFWEVALNVVPDEKAPFGACIKNQLTA
jgi:hypothetical protein